MKRIGIFLALCLATAGCKRDHTETAAAPPTFNDKGLGASERVGKYLLDEVVASKLRTCWSQLKGEGAVAVDLNFKKSGELWNFVNAKATKSSLAEGQDLVAQQCIEESARGTSFAVDSKQTLETVAPSFVVRLGWPVPLPPEGTGTSTSQMARMIGGGGVITISGCSDCARRTEYPYGYKCVSKSSGSNVDCEEIQANICATTPKACLRGAFGGTRGVIMF